MSKTYPIHEVLLSLLAQSTMQIT